MKQQIESKLHSLLNKNVSYGKHLLTITGYSFNEEKERVYIHTNEKDNHYDRPYDGIIGFLKEFQVLNGEVQKLDNHAIAVSNANNLAGQLKDILLDNIKKVQDDAGYVKQATVINNNVNTLVNLTKLQMNFAKQNRDK